jgi:segregation and condensation protein B
VEGIQSHIEALIFVAEMPLSVKEIQDCLVRLVGIELNTEEIESHIEVLIQKYHEGNFPFEVVPIAGGYQFLTKPAFQPTVSEFLKSKLNKKLSTNSLKHWPSLLTGNLFPSRILKEYVVSTAIIRFRNYWRKS